MSSEIIKNNDENFEQLSEQDEDLINKSIDLIKTTNKLRQVSTKKFSNWV